MTTSTLDTAHPDTRREQPLLTQRAILWFWLPLAFSWLLMLVEGPWVQAVISRKDDAERQLAAFGLVVSLSVTIEAPVIMLLATSSALARHRQAYRVLWRFMMGINVVVTLIALLMAFTPLLDAYLGGLLGIPPDIIAATRPGMVIMILWSALIGYRRFYQGILIRNNQTRTVGYGAIVRVVASGGVALLLGIFTDQPGAVIGAWALIGAVAAEAVYAYIVSRTTVARVQATARPANEPALTYRAALAFHLPLAVTSVLTLLIRPVIESGLASTPQAQLVLAAFPIVYSLALLLRAGGFAWQEVVIALAQGEAQQVALHRFTWVMGLASTGLTAIFALTPLIDGYLAGLLAVPVSIRPLVVTGMHWVILLPLLTALQSYWRALLMLAGNTNPIYIGMGISFAATWATMWGGLALGLEGIIIASLALTVGALVELGFLWRAFQPHRGTLRQRWQQERLAD